ncbi:MAG TPA: DUF3823 domain-containing protein [Hanamia sp.]|nr:DUF3823 domain-containing protein [Hanamia sp.]
MKNLFRYILIPVMAFSFFSCKKDNYSQPGAFLTGAILYNNDTIYVERNQVPYQLYQYGFGKVGQIGSNTTFEQNGSYSQALFNGDYKLIIPNGQGPFMWKQDASGNPDSLSITLKGNQTVNLEVTPYYMVRNATFSYSSSDSMITASFKAEKIITDAVNAKDIERVSLYINKTNFVSGGDNIAFTDMAGGAIADPDNITLKVQIPFLDPKFATTQNYIFARVGIKIVNVEDMIFSPLQKISL